MIEVIIIVVIFLAILIISLYFILKQLVSKINNETKTIFTLKLQVYDDLIKEREKKLNDINVKDKNQEKVTEKINNNINIHHFELKEEYQVESILQKVKNIENKFQINEELIIKNFLSELNNNVNEYNELIQLKKQIETYGIYNLLVSEDNGKNYLCNLNINNSTLKEMFNDIEFNLTEFMDRLDLEISKSDPVVYVEVGDKKINYNYLSNRVRTVYNEHIYKGIKIYYRNCLYDYSIE